MPPVDPELVERFKEGIQEVIKQTLEEQAQSTEI